MFLQNGKSILFKKSAKFGSKVGGAGQSNIEIIFAMISAPGN